MRLDLSSFVFLITKCLSIHYGMTKMFETLWARDGHLMENNRYRKKKLSQFQ